MACVVQGDVGHESTSGVSVLRWETTAGTDMMWMRKDLSKLSEKCAARTGLKKKHTHTHTHTQKHLPKLSHSPLIRDPPPPSAFPFSLHSPSTPLSSISFRSHLSILQHTPFTTPHPSILPLHSLCCHLSNLYLPPPLSPLILSFYPSLRPTSLPHSCLSSLSHSFSRESATLSQVIPKQTLNGVSSRVTFMQDNRPRRRCDGEQPAIEIKI